MTNQLDKRFIKNDAVDGDKTLLLNNQWLRALLTNSTVKNILRINGSDLLEFNDAPHVNVTSISADALQTKAQIDASILVETNRASAAEALLIPLAQKGAINGVATLGADQKVPASQLPSYVDDVLEYADYASLPGTGESGKIYVILAASGGFQANQQFRWSGSAYQPIIASPGTTDNVPEGSTNLYFTNARAIAALASITNALSARITVLENRIWNKSHVVIAAAHLTNQYFDLPHLIRTGTEHLRLGRLWLNSTGATPDYTLSTVSGVTRVTFAGDIATGGIQQLALNDVIHYQYEYNP